MMRAGWDKNQDAISMDPEKAGRTMSWTREHEQDNLLPSLKKNAIYCKLSCSVPKNIEGGNGVPHTNFAEIEVVYISR